MLMRKCTLLAILKAELKQVKEQWKTISPAASWSVVPSSRARNREARLRLRERIYVLESRIKAVSAPREGASTGEKDDL